MTMGSPIEDTAESTMSVKIGENRFFNIYEDTVVKSDGLVTRAGEPSAKKKRRIAVVAKKLWHGRVLLATENGSIRVVQVKDDGNERTAPAVFTDGQFVPPHCTLKCHQPSVIISTESTVFVGTQRGEIYCFDDEFELLNKIETDEGPITSLKLRMSKKDSNFLRVKFESGESSKIQWSSQDDNEPSAIDEEELDIPEINTSTSEELLNQEDQNWFMNGNNCKVANEVMVAEPMNDEGMEEERSDEEQGPAVKKLRIRESTAGDNWKRSETLLTCLGKGCDFSTWVAQTFITHLRMVHRTTPALAGIVLRCACGEDVFSHHHSRLCSVSNFTVVRKDYFGPPRTLVDKMTPKCTICYEYPMTPYGFANHLQTKHKTSLWKIQCYLKCGMCGEKFNTRNETSLHAKRCKSRFYQLLKIGEASETEKEAVDNVQNDLLEVKRITPQCTLCKAYPKTIGGYIQHLYNTHDRTLFEIKHYLKCGVCAVVVSTKLQSQAHSKKCKTRSFELLKAPSEELTED
ncbi:hypothetical protein PRIPAC_72437 [Pristionchus pacificus]|nr:hypothetical protein PRIPAC_72437 [Pristionchus pacificus]